LRRERVRIDFGREPGIGEHRRWSWP